MLPAPVLNRTVDIVLAVDIHCTYRPLCDGKSGGDRVCGRPKHHFNQRFVKFVQITRHATISWGESVFLKRKSVSIRIIHQCIDASRHFVFVGDSHRDAVCKKNPDTA